MAYKTMNIRSVIEKAERNELCLPAIQRKYVWKAEQIEKLFDSLYQGYPIGTFLMWNVPKEQINHYKFYSFLRDYHEDNGNFNDLTITDPDKEVTSVLDGQQRITSLFMALKGTYTIVKYKREFKKQLYFNLVAFASNAEEIIYFKLLSKEEAQNDDTAAWVKVGDFLNPNWLAFTNTHNRNYDLLGNLISNHPQKELIQNVRLEGINSQRLFDAVERIIKMLQSDENISYYEVKGNEGLDTVTEIFIRINSGGKVLSKSDLLFSTVVSRWEEGREKIDELLKELKEMEYDLDTDFVMRTCLYLTGSPILFKVGNFNNETVEKIIVAFEKDGDMMDIKTSILLVFNYLKYDLGLHDKALKSKNVLIPMIYHVYKGGSLDISTLTSVQKYLYISLLQGVFGSHGDTLLGQLRSGVTYVTGNYALEGKPFDFAKLITGISDRQKLEAYRITDETIENWLSKKGNDAFMVLSLAYGELPESYDSYSLDYLHPRHFFKKSNFPEGEYNEIKDFIDTVPALIFASARDRELRKEDHSLLTYIQTILPARGVSSQDYKSLHFLENNDSLELQQFTGLFEKRAGRLKNKLIDLLKKPDVLPPDVGKDKGDDDVDPAGPEGTPPTGPGEFHRYSEDHQKQEAGLINRIPEEIERLDRLGQCLKDSKLSFILPGEYDLKEILKSIKMKFLEFCNDDYVCEQHCLSGNNGPEWEHKVRGYLDGKKRNPNSRVSRTVNGKWKLR